MDVFDRIRERTKPETKAKIQKLLDDFKVNKKIIDVGSYFTLQQILSMIADEINNSAMIHSPDNADKFVDVLSAKLALELELVRFFNLITECNEQ